VRASDYPTFTTQALMEVREERDRQDTKWGPQDHEVLYRTTSPATFARLAEFWQKENDFRVQEGFLSWDGVLLEEVAEALAETDPAKREVELIQVAAVAVAMVECSRRNRLA
jgi:hypothetical protein